MAKSVSIYPLGVGDSGTKIHWHTTFLLCAGDCGRERRWMIDCPRFLLDMLAYNRQHGDLDVTLVDYQEIILTHLHFDHAEGIVELANSRALAEGPPVTLYAPAPMLDYLWSDAVERGVMSAAQVIGGAQTLDRLYQPVPLDNPHDFGAFQLHYRPTQHIPNTYAYRFDFGDLKLGYSADTAYDPSLIDWLQDCDVIIHEVLLPPWSDVESVRAVHTPWTDLLNLPAEFQAKTWLCHYGDNYLAYSDLGQYRYLRQNRRMRLAPQPSPR